MRLEGVALIVDDYDRGIAFFVDVLGFELAEGPEQLAAVGHQFAGQVGLLLRVDGFEPAYRRLLANGVAFVREPGGDRWDLLGPVPAAGGG